MVASQLRSMFAKKQSIHRARSGIRQISTQHSTHLSIQEFFAKSTMVVAMEHFLHGELLKLIPSKFENQQ